MSKTAKKKQGTKQASRPVSFVKRWLRRFLLLGVLGVTIFAALNLWMVVSTAPQNFDDVNQIPAQQVGLVLGTSSRVVGGKPNLFFRYRMEAAAELYHAGKVQYLLVSGDNRAAEYNEPSQMRTALKALGVPEHAVIADYAGLRTLDSIIRAKEVFGQSELTIISQASHNHRALYIAGYHGIDAYGFAAKSPSLGSAWRVRMREYIARILAFSDLYIFDRRPRHLGDPIPIPPPQSSGMLISP